LKPSKTRIVHTLDALAGEAPGFAFLVSAHKLMRAKLILRSLSSQRTRMSGSSSPLPCGGCCDDPSGSQGRAANAIKATRALLTPETGAGRHFPDTLGSSWSYSAVSSAESSRDSPVRVRVVVEASHACWDGENHREIAPCGRSRGVAGRRRPGSCSLRCMAAEILPHAG